MNSTKLFSTSLKVGLLYTRVFVPCKFLQPSLMFTGKDKSLKGSGITNIRLDHEGLLRTNALAYLTGSSVTMKKVFLLWHNDVLNTQLITIRSRGRIHNTSFSS